MKNVIMFTILMLNIYSIRGMEENSMPLLPFLTPHCLVDIVIPVYTFFFLLREDVWDICVLKKAEKIAIFNDYNIPLTMSLGPNILNSLIKYKSLPPINRPDAIHYYLEEFFKHNTNPNVLPISLWHGIELAPWQTALEVNNEDALDLCFKYGLNSHNKKTVFKDCIIHNKYTLLPVCFKNGMHPDLVANVSYNNTTMLDHIIKKNQTYIMKCLIENGLSRSLQEDAFSQTMINVLQRSPLLVQLFFLTPNTYPDSMLKIGLKHWGHIRKLSLKDRCVEYLLAQQHISKKYTLSEKKLIKELMYESKINQLEQNSKAWNTTLDRLSLIPELYPHKSTVLSFKIQEQDKELIYEHGKRSIMEQLDEIDF